MQIKAIETKYKGYRFRSRLEARWAVFFDALGVPYSYEMEGYDLSPEAGWYLPDFWLPTENSFVEIKPGPPPVSEHTPEQEIAYLLHYYALRDVYLMYGDPYDALSPGFPGMIAIKGNNESDGLQFLYLSDYEAAALKARQARFEHGETPAIR